MRLNLLAGIRLHAWRRNGAKRAAAHNVQGARPTLGPYGIIEHNGFVLYRRAVVLLNSAHPQFAAAKEKSRYHEDRDDVENIFTEHTYVKRVIGMESFLGETFFD